MDNPQPSPKSSDKDAVQRLDGDGSDGEPHAVLFPPGLRYSLAPGESPGVNALKVAKCLVI